ncbi:MULTISPECIES: hypothetical protein [Nostocales]|uniref:Uncharacterized protein n=2 Tax=Nostocales TaxID=1161 RepID=A0ABW8WR42_9CYAN|nr:hypothetical protein [Tolypothrix bouteillei]
MNNSIGTENDDIHPYVRELQANFWCDREANGTHPNRLSCIIHS